MKLRTCIFLSFFLWLSCSEQEARKPVSSSKTYSLSSATKFLKKINEKEEANIKKYIENDSLNLYTRSSNGFWYRYLHKIEIDTIVPKKGNTIEFSYDIANLDAQMIYSSKEIGVKKYRVDQEDLILGLQKGIKIMKPGETIKFIFPSFNAYGVVGDGKKIGINQSLISKVTLINIK